MPENRSTFRRYNTAGHPRPPPLALKRDVTRRCFENGEDVRSVSNEVGYRTAGIYAWRRKYILKGSVALMNSSKERKRGKLSEGEPASFEIEDFKAPLFEMRLEIDILKETINVLKKTQAHEQSRADIHRLTHNEIIALPNQTLEIIILFMIFVSIKGKSNLPYVEKTFKSIL